MSNPIQVQQTPNPNARKFVIPGTKFPGSTNYGAAELESAAGWIGELFQLEGVYNVFTAQDFVTVNKRPEVPWQTLEEHICRILAGQFLQV